MRIDVSQPNSTTHYMRPISFTRVFDNGGNYLTLPGLNTLSKNSYKKKYKKSNDTANKVFEQQIERIKSKNFSSVGSNSTIDNILNSVDNVDTSAFGGRFTTTRLGMYSSGSPYYDTVQYENPYHFAADALHAMNTYKYRHKHPTKVPLGAYETPKTNDANGQKQKETQATQYDRPNIRFMNVPTTLSMFNPNFNVQTIGMNANTPLLTDTTHDNMMGFNDESIPVKTTSDCSIRTLVALSNAGTLGASTYRFSDFMYCEELGSMSNNHLITLRKFNLPVGDHISVATNKKWRKKGDNDIGWDVGPDAGHLVTWFGTSNNKLEDILNYSYRYSWKELKSKIQELDSQEDDPSRGIIGKLGNLTAGYNDMLNAGLTGGHNFFSGFVNKALERTGLSNLIGNANPSGDRSQLDRLRNYDNNKVYSPLQTVQDMHIPEGVLSFSHEFSLTFSYKLRAYENINPKAAFLDLLNNILKVTYFDGKFWGGQQKIVGPKPNNSAYRKAYHMIDNAFDKIGNFMTGLADGSIDGDYLLGMISNLASAASDVISSLKDQAKEALQNGPAQFFRDTVGAAIDLYKKLDNKYHITNGIKGALKNSLGRPAFYAFDSLLSGNDTGLWHVTIGNPRNPIVSFGNLIMTDASIQHSGPLGLDDFPTNIRVTVKLKHARSRDAAAIGKMYTSGLSPLSYSQQYNTFDQTRLEDSASNIWGQDNMGYDGVIPVRSKTNVTETPTPPAQNAAKQEAGANDGTGGRSNSGTPATPAATTGNNDPNAQPSSSSSASSSRQTTSSRRRQGRGQRRSNKDKTAQQPAAQTQATGNTNTTQQTAAKTESTTESTTGSTEQQTQRSVSFNINDEDVNAANQAHEEMLQKLQEYMLANDTLDGYDNITYTIQKSGQAMIFHNGSDNLVAIMTSADQDATDTN